MDTTGCHRRSDCDGQPDVWTSGSPAVARNCHPVAQPFNWKVSAPPSIRRHQRRLPCPNPAIRQRVQQSPRHGHHIHAAMLIRPQSSHGSILIPNRLARLSTSYICCMNNGSPLEPSYNYYDYNYIQYDADPNGDERVPHMQYQQQDPYNYAVGSSQQVDYLPPCGWDLNLLDPHNALGMTQPPQAGSYLPVDSCNALYINSNAAPSLSPALPINPSTVNTPSFHYTENSHQNQVRFEYLILSTDGAHDRFLFSQFIMLRLFHPQSHFGHLRVFQQEAVDEDHQLEASPRRLQRP